MAMNPVTDHKNREPNVGPGNSGSSGSGHHMALLSRAEVRLRHPGGATALLR